MIAGGAAFRAWATQQNGDVAKGRWPGLVGRKTRRAQDFGLLELAARAGFELRREILPCLGPRIFCNVLPLCNM
jgi:hypothetical protein